MTLCVCAPAGSLFAMLLWRWCWFPVQQWAGSWWCSAVGHWVLWVCTVAFWDLVYLSDPLYSYSTALACTCTDTHKNFRKSPLLPAETQKETCSYYNKHSYEDYHIEINFATMDHAVCVCASVYLWVCVTLCCCGSADHGCRCVLVNWHHTRMQVHIFHWPVSQTHNHCRGNHKNTSIIQFG